MARNDSDELVEQINNSGKAGKYALSSYKPDRNRLYRLDEVTADGKHLRVVSDFMVFSEMKGFLMGFIAGMDACPSTL